MARTVRVVSLGGSLRAASTSRTALQAALEGAAGKGADVQLTWVRELALPFYTAERAIPAAAHEFADVVYDCDATIWSSPTYHGSVSGSFKNALDWLILLAKREPPCPTSRSGSSPRPAESTDCRPSTDGLHRPRPARLERSCRPCRSPGGRLTQTGILPTKRSARS